MTTIAKLLAQKHQLIERLQLSLSAPMTINFVWNLMGASNVRLFSARIVGRPVGYHDHWLSKRKIAIAERSRALWGDVVESITGGWLSVVTVHGGRFGDFAGNRLVPL